MENQNSEESERGFKGQHPVVLKMKTRDTVYEKYAKITAPVILSQA